MMKPSCLAAILYAVAGIAAMLSVGVAAFAAHGLAHVASANERAAELFKRGTEFQMTHALALILIAIVADRLMPGLARNILWTAAGFMIAAFVLFPTALYASAFDKPHFWAPWGGMAAMIGWLLFAVGALLTIRAVMPPP
jgi:uncharacterized membrane protein YgdD (TMEM256/DUF423 family)